MSFTQNHLGVSIPEILDLANLYVAEAPLKKKSQHFVLTPLIALYKISVLKPPKDGRVNNIIHIFF